MCTLYINLDTITSAAISWTVTEEFYVIHDNSFYLSMMMARDGNIFYITAPLCKEPKIDHWSLSTNSQ